MEGSWGGRHADIIIVEDPIKDDKAALSALIMEDLWQKWNTVMWGRLREGVSCVVVTTRWMKKDLPGRIYDRARATGEKWTVIKFRGLAGEGDILGRKEGEALCSEMKTKAALEQYRRENPRWFAAAVQQEPEEEENPLFSPDEWPTYQWLGNAWSVSERPNQRRFIGKGDMLVLATVDWATSEKKSADFTAIGVFGLAPDGILLVLEVVNERFPIETVVAELAKVCRKWHPNLVAVETGGFQTALAIECRRWREIPEVRRLEPEWGANLKYRRAVPAIIMGQNRRIYLPETVQDHPWYLPYTEQLRGFTGKDDDHDDMVDVTGYGCQIAGELRPPESVAPEPILLSPGYVDRWSQPS
jgi:phage terminase large subunit-like protein